MKTISKMMAPLMLITSTAFAGPISSGGVNQQLLSCADASGSITLSVQVINSDHLEAMLIDGSSIDSVPTFISEVAGTEDGYASADRSYQVSLANVEGKKVATVLITSGEEPLVYSNLNCGSESVK